jgi:hypothetical protein
MPERVRYWRFLLALREWWELPGGDDDDQQASGIYGTADDGWRFSTGVRDEFADPGSVSRG